MYLRMNVTWHTILMMTSMRTTAKQNGAKKTNDTSQRGHPSIERHFIALYIFECIHTWPTYTHTNNNKKAISITDKAEWASAKRAKKDWCVVSGGSTTYVGTEGVWHLMRSMNLASCQGATTINNRQTQYNQEIVKQGGRRWRQRRAKELLMRKLNGA